MYWRMKNGMALKKGQWKLVHHGKTPDAGTDELYNIYLDPSEKEDVSMKNEQILQELKYEINKQFFLDSQVLAQEIQ